MADYKPTNREKVKEIVASIEGGIKELFQSEQYAEYLRTMSRFHNYSYRNTLLIHMQRPDATLVAGFSKWKNQFQRHVKKGEKGMTILAPTPFKKKIEEMKLDPDTNIPLRDDDGNFITEEKVVEIPMFRPVKVFDVKQTEGKPIPSLSMDLTGNVQHYEAFLEALRRTSPVPVEIKPIPESMDGYFSPTKQRIAVRDDMSEVQTVCAVLHEITHATLHNRQREQDAASAGTEGTEPAKPRDEQTEEVEAESVSFAVCQYYGIETSANSLGYIAAWSSGKELPELKASLETISKTANFLITTIDRHFEEICKERGIVLEQAEPDTPAASDTLEQFAADLYDFMEQLHQAGVLEHPFTSDPREQSISDIVTEMRTGYFDGVRDPLAFLIEHTDLITARTLMERMNALEQTEQDTADLEELANETQSGYIFTVERNPQPTGRNDQHLLRARDASDQTLNPEQVLFIGSEAVCGDLLGLLQSGELRPDDFFHVTTASVSRYVTEDGAQLDAFVSMDDKVYLGLRDHYDNRGHYINHDKSLLHVSDHYAMFKFLCGIGYNKTQSEMLEEGFFTQENYAEFAALQTDVLTQFQEAEPLMFAGEPFCFIPLDASEVRQEVPSASEMTESEEPQEALYLVDTKLDEYPLPDPVLMLSDLEIQGYSGRDILPLTRERAAELLDRDMTIYIVRANEDPEMIFDQDDLMKQPDGMMFAVPCEEWEASQDFQQAVADRMNHQEEREKAFLDHTGDCFAIYQMPLNEETRFLRFEPLDRLRENGAAVERGRYDLVYTSPLPDAASVDAALNSLWEKFNINHPADFRHPSLSVSDIVAIRKGGVLSCHYVDDIGFAALPDFISRKPTVAELEAQVKAGQTISLMDLADAVHREKKKSVVAQLKEKPARERSKPASKKNLKKER